MVARQGGDSTVCLQPFDTFRIHFESDYLFSNEQNPIVCSAGTIRHTVCWASMRSFRRYDILVGFKCLPLPRPSLASQLCEKPSIDQQLGLWLERNFRCRTSRIVHIA